MKMKNLFMNVSRNDGFSVDNISECFDRIDKYIKEGKGDFIVEIKSKKMESEIRKILNDRYEIDFNNNLNVMCCGIVLFR